MGVLRDMTKYCSHCKRGEVLDSEAHGLYRGTEYTPYGDAPMPFRALLCEDHATMIDEDGGIITLIELVNYDTLI